MELRGSLLEIKEKISKPEGEHGINFENGLSNTLRLNIIYLYQVSVKVSRSNSFEGLSHTLNENFSLILKFQDCYFSPK